MVSQTGSNAIPLGTRKRPGLGSEEAPSNYIPEDLPDAYKREQAMKQELAESTKRAAESTPEEGMYQLGWSLDADMGCVVIKW